MIEKCPGMSVGVVAVLPDKRILMIERLTPPLQWACPAGHVEDAKNGDDKEAFLRTAVRELAEEVGLSISPESFRQVGHFLMSTPCSRGGTMHRWRVYEVRIHEEPQNLKSCEEDREKIGEIAFFLSRRFWRKISSPFDAWFLPDWCRLEHLLTNNEQVLFYL